MEPEDAKTKKQLIREQVQKVLNSADAESGFRAVLCRPLEEEGRCLSDSDEFSGSLLPVLVCEALGGDFRLALPAAAAIELLAAAGDIFDDIEDRDYRHALWRVYGQAQAVNAANALLVLAYMAVRRLEGTGVALDIIFRTMDTLDRAILRACNGQYYDFVYENKVGVSEDMYFEMLALKSGPFMGAACSIGAMMATRDEQTIASISEFGYNFGIAAQIADDIRSLTDVRSAKSDIKRRKKTLPVIYALARCKGREHEFLAEVYGGKAKMTTETENEVREIVINSGGIHYSLMMAETYKQRALKALKETGIPAEKLELLIHARDS